MLRRRGWPALAVGGASGQDRLWAGSGSLSSPRRHRPGNRRKPLPPIVPISRTGWGGVPCWVGRSARWVRFTVPIAYDLRYDTRVRPVLGLTRSAALRCWLSRRPRGIRRVRHRPAVPPHQRPPGRRHRPVGAHRATRGCRPAPAGVATEVLRGRQRTCTERLASGGSATGDAAGHRCGPCTTTPCWPSSLNRCHPIPKGLFYPKISQF